MSIFPKKWQGRLIPEPPKHYVKDGKIYETKTNKRIKFAKFKVID